MFKYASGGGGGSSQTQPLSFSFSSPSSSSPSLFSFPPASNTGSDGRSGFSPFGTPANNTGRSGFSPFGTSVTVDPPPSFCSATSLFPACSFYPSQNQIPPKSRKSKTRKKASKPDSPGISITTYDERVFMNELLSKSPGKEEAPSVDSQIKKKIPDEIKHAKVKREAERDPISNSPFPMMVVSRILKGIPQNPHFLPFHGYSETARANLEGAWDRTFEETVEQMHALRASDFWVRARKLWKTMEELQSLGYNVLVLRKRVVELTEVVLKQEKRQNEIRGLKDRAEDHRMEKSRLESVILNLKAQAQSEQNKMVEMLIEVADKEKELPQLEIELANLAIQPLEA